MNFDVAFVGGGPAASSCGCILKKYRPDLKIGIFEREIFPRDHVGESQLPIIGSVLNEIGVWDKVEAANFPVKIGATYRWGNSQDLWDFNFLLGADFKEEPRPGKYEGQRLDTAFQVDRSIYDKILLDHAREFGCEVFEDCAVREVQRTGDRVTRLLLENGESVEARYYIDASGHSGLLRRAMGIGIEEPSNLRNIAIWDYWQNAEWAVNLGIGGTRIQVMSIGYGWIWFIPLGPTRTSIGLVCPADYYKKAGLKPEELLLKAISDEPRVKALTVKATREGKLFTTKDWSFVAERMAGENWLLIGEAAGFADPILSAGLSLAHISAREAAYSIMEIDQGESKEWLFRHYEHRNRRKVLQHIKFADYWYTANAHFTELKEYTRQIADDAGLELDAEEAFQWLGTGGFVEADMSVGGLGSFSLDGVHMIAKRLSEKPPISVIDGHSLFMLNLKNADQVEVPLYEKGRVYRMPAYLREGKLLPLVGVFGRLVAGLQVSPSLDKAANVMRDQLIRDGMTYNADFHSKMVQCLEAMARDGWVKCKKFSGSAPITVDFLSDNGFIEPNRDEDLPPGKRAENLRA
ncbi:MAG TPA: NAD(P)/FAD-dependent oxidoreductase [Fimbriimonas sp.]|nr:NAD(P)/FAD-dependent oxidoreductase [Fimbriimonas sp.]